MPAKKKARYTSPFKLYGIIAALFAVGLAAVFYRGLDLSLLASWLISINIVAFLVYGFDKMKAQGTGLRVPENVLYGLVILGGWGGGLAGMVLFRHKISKGSFQQVFWTIIVLEIVAICVWRFVIYD
ncbi:DUF1294 domain-containing protein [Chloroflexota bacterium]